jgi:hypothetical protein
MILNQHRKAILSLFFKLEAVFASEFLLIFTLQQSVW